MGKLVGGWRRLDAPQHHHRRAVAADDGGGGDLSPPLLTSLLVSPAVLALVGPPLAVGKPRPLTFSLRLLGRRSQELQDVHNLEPARAVAVTPSAVNVSCSDVRNGPKQRRRATADVIGRQPSGEA